MGQKQSTRGKWGSSFLLSLHFPRVLNVETPSGGPVFRSARTGTLATQASFEPPQFVLEKVHTKQPDTF